MEGMVVVQPLNVHVDDDKERSFQGDDWASVGNYPVVDQQ